MQGRMTSKQRDFKYPEWRLIGLEKVIRTMIGLEH